MPFVSVREDFLYQHSTTSSCKDEVVECWYKKSSPGSSKKTAMAHDKLLTFVAPSNPHFKVATEKGWTYLTWMAVFSEGRRRQPERNNFEVGGHGGPHAWIYCSIGWLFFMKNPVSSVLHLTNLGSKMISLKGCWWDVHRFSPETTCNESWAPMLEGFPNHHGWSGELVKRNKKNHLRHVADKWLLHCICNAYMYIYIYTWNLWMSNVHPCPLCSNHFFIIVPWSLESSKYFLRTY